MHEFLLTYNSKSTDECIRLANKAHNYYFENALKYKKEFIATSLEFINAIESKIKSKAQIDDIKKALAKIGYKGAMLTFICNEINFIKNRMTILSKHPEFIDRDNLFILENTARFMEFIIPYTCSKVKEVVEDRRKFSFKQIIMHEYTFFDFPSKELRETKKYIGAFYESGWRAQKYLNGYEFIRRHLNENDPKIKDFLDKYGVFDAFSSIIFARMANEQLLKYLSDKNPIFWKHIEKYLLSDKKENKGKIVNLLKEKDYDHIFITTYKRLKALQDANIINELIKNEVDFINKKGNNVAHNGASLFYYSCYYNLQLLSYLKNKYLGVK